MDIQAAKLALLLALAAENPSPNTLYERMVGNVGYTIFEGRGEVELRVDKIEHNVGNTGTMKVVLWACTECMRDNSGWKGHRIAELRLDGIPKGYSYSNIKRTVPLLKRPPNGRYIALMTLESQQEEAALVAEGLVEAAFGQTRPLFELGDRPSDGIPLGNPQQCIFNLL